MLIFNYGEWAFWETYDPDGIINDYTQPTWGNQKVTFDGPNKLILVNYGETELDFRIDVFSNWKEWLLINNQINTKYPQALSEVGGDPLPGESRFLGITYFLENGWKMKTWDGDHRLTVTGNVFQRDGSTVFIPPDNNFNTEITLNVSNLVDLIQTGVLAGYDTVTQMDELHTLAALKNASPKVVSSSGITAGDITQTLSGDDPVTVTRTDT